MKLSVKLITLFLLIGVIPALIIGIIALTTASKDMKDQKKVTFGTLNAVREIKKGQIEQYFAERQGDMGVLMETVGTLRKEAFAKLGAIQAIKKNQIESYFSERLGDVSVLSTNDTASAALRAFKVAFDGESNRTGGTVWTEAEQVYGTWLTQYKQEYGYYDLFLISADGDVVYTVAKESDLGQNLVTGSLKASPLGKCFRNAISGIATQDFEPYAPSNNEPCAFVGAPVKKDGQTIGVVALQLPLDAINGIMQERSGLGETGECYLVGSDKLMRSDSFLDPTGHSVKASFAGTIANNGCNTEAVTKALAGQSGAEIIKDYNGNPVLSAYAPLKIQGIEWVILAEIDVAEAFCPVDENGNEFFSKYVEMYGYYDLFLINPDGYCWYTDAKEADYQTNLVSGKYSSTGLGKLIRRVMQTRQFGLEDFSPYAPSNDEPCGFIAQPVVFKGKVELIVALQLPLEAINKIMQLRVGMGQTGESYLVGPDKLMRSDSFLDAQGHSVKASFAGTVERNGVDTEAAREALAGNSGAKVITDYNGNQVLSAYTPVVVGGITWALISEVDEAEAYAGLKNLQFVLGTVAIISLVTIVAISVFFSRSITKPINRIIAGLTEGSEQVSSASGQVSSASQSLAEGSTEQAAGLEETSSSLEEMASMTKQNADNAQQANTLASEARKAADTGSEAMQRMSTAITDIQKSSDETAKIIKVIDEIAFQTNLLALNAAVEAARAGEAGKGFAVVAEEVRNLAMRSAEAAKNTSAMIEESVKNSKNGVDIASEVGKVLEEIVQGIGKTTDLVSEIAAASQEQSQGIDQINTAMAQLDKVTQQNAANAEESASASEELSAQAEQMNEVVGELVTLVGGSATTGQSKSSGGGGRHHLDIKVDHSAAQKAHQALNKTKQHGFSKSDQAFHKIADGQKQQQWQQHQQQAAQPAAKQAVKPTVAEKAIPLNGDENASSDDFKEFNG